MNIAETVRKAIAECGMSRYELAKRTGVSQSTLSRFALGKSSLTLEKLDALASVLGISVTVKRSRRSRS